MTLRDRTKRASSLKRSGTPRAPGTPRQSVSFAEGMDVSWEEVGSSQDESESTASRAAASAASEAEATGQLAMDPAVKGWKRMMIKLGAFHDAKDATAMLEEIRSEGNTKTAELDCPHPPYAYRERTNQYAKWARCEACKSRLWTRSLTVDERAAQLQRKADRQARKGGREQLEKDAQAMVKPPFEPPRMSSIPKKKTENTKTEASAASSASASTTEMNRLAEVLQGNTEAVAKMAEAIQGLVSRRT